MRFNEIRQWAEDRNLIDGSTVAKQYNKLLEEVDELHDAIVNKQDDEFVDAVGDCIVVLTIMAAQMGLKVEGCIEAAYQEIKDRKGRMLDGLFVKEADLPENLNK